MNFIKNAFFIVVLISSSALGIEKSKPSAELKATFGAIQAIRGLAAELAQEATSHNQQITLEGNEHPKQNEPNPSYHRTQQGLFLRSEDYPKSLATPWGEIYIFGRASTRNYPINTFFDKFRKKMKLKFVRNICENGSLYPQYNVKFFKDNFQNPLTAQELEQYRGTDAEIISDFCGCESLYAIESVNGIQLPKAEQQTLKKFHDNEIAYRSWNDLVKNHLKTLDQVSR